MDFRKYLPYIAALLIFFGVTLISFWPAFTGDVLKQADIEQFKSMSHETALFRKQYGTEPLWTSSMFCGMPTTQVSQIYPGNWMTKIDEALHLWLPRPAGYIFLAFCGFFVLLLSLKINPWLSIAGSLAFGLSTFLFLALKAGHHSKANSIDYLPFILAGIVLLMNKKRWLGFGILCLFTALEFSANHLQITYYTFLLVFILLVNYFFISRKNNELRSYFTGIGFFAAAVFIALLPNAGNLLMTQEYAKHSTRNQTELTIRPGDLKSNSDNQTGGVTKDYAFEWSNGTDEVFTFLVPNYKGGASVPLKESEHADLSKVNPAVKNIAETRNSYFGDLPKTDGAVYFGIVILFFAIAGIFISRHPLRWGLLAATVLAIFLAMGKNFLSLNEFILEYLPGYNRFRSVTMILVIAQVCIPLLAVFAIDALISPKKNGIDNENFRPLKITGWILLGCCVLIAALPSLFNNFEAAGEAAFYKQKYLSEGASEKDAEMSAAVLLENVKDVRRQLVQTDAIRSALFLLSAILLTLLFLRKKIGSGNWIAALSLLILIDLLLINNRYINRNSYQERSMAEAAPPLTKTDERILADSSYFRVANGTVDNLFVDASTSYYHHSIGGYSAAKLGRYDDLIRFSLIPELNDFALGIDSVKRNDSLLNVFMQQFPALNMLNTKYFIVRGKQGRGLVLNKMANGNAWFVKERRTVANADSEIVALRKFDPAQTVIIRETNLKNKKLPLKWKGEGSIRLETERPNELVYKSSSSENEFAVFSEIWYPDGWQATIDNQPAEIYSVNYLLRGMEIPAGDHRIVFTYLPQTYSSGNKIAVAGSVLVLLISGCSFLFALRRREKQN